jgi:hypothetical protein
MKLADNTTRHLAKLRREVTHPCLRATNETTVPTIETGPTTRMPRTITSSVAWPNTGISKAKLTVAKATTLAALTETIERI